MRKSPASPGLAGCHVLGSDAEFRPAKRPSGKQSCLIRGYAQNHGRQYRTLQAVFRQCQLQEMAFRHGLQSDLQQGRKAV